MKAIVLLLALASAAFADEYTPVDWLEVTEDPVVGITTDDGERKVRVGFYALTGGAGCLAGGFTINDVRYSIRTSKWQMRQGEDSAWSDVLGTEHTNSGVCGLTSDMPLPPGEYRVVAEVEVDGVMGKYASRNSIFADEYTPVDWLEVTEDSVVGITTEDGERKVRVGFYALTGGAGCLAGGFTINDVRYSIRTSKWQMRQGEDSAWSDVLGTEHTNSGVCGLTSDMPLPPGEYRVVAEVEVDGAMGKYASRSSIVIAGALGTAVEAVTWGALKARTTR